MLCLLLALCAMLGTGWAPNLRNTSGHALGERWQIVRFLHKDGWTINRVAVEFGRSIEQVPHHVLAGFYLGRLLEQTDRTDEAVEHYRRMGRAQIEAQLPDAALDSLTRVVKLRPDSVDARNELAVLLIRTGQLDAAIEQFEEALRRAPRNAGIERNLERARALRRERDGG